MSVVAERKFEQDARMQEHKLITVEGKGSSAWILPFIKSWTWKVGRERRSDTNSPSSYHQKILVFSPHPHLEELSFFVGQKQKNILDEKQILEFFLNPLKGAHFYVWKCNLVQNKFLYRSFNYKGLILKTFKWQGNYVKTWYQNILIKKNIKL